MTIGAEELLEKYKGSRMRVAEALLRGEIDGDCFVDEVVSPITLKAAEFRVRHGLDGKKPIEKKRRRNRK